MNILFVCQGNVARSQFAEALFNDLYHGNIVGKSAGTDAERYLGRDLRAFAHHTVSCMKEIGYEIGYERAKQITPQMVDVAHRIIVMADNTTWPQFLSNSQKVEVWYIKDVGGMDYEGHAMIRDEVKRKVNGLVLNLEALDQKDRQIEM